MFEAHNFAKLFAELYQKFMIFQAVQYTHT